MELKRYQRRVIEEVERFLAQMAKHKSEGNVRHPALDAWTDLHLGIYNERKNGLGEDLPTFCIKVPTGGGKTLLATQALGSIYRTILKERNGAGLVLWVVPSSQIYRDTLRRLSDRRDLYRLMLEHAASRRIELWEKQDIARLSPGRLRDCLNILVVQLASTNRETKEQLKFFKDSGGNIVQHFPPEDDWAAHQALKARVANLDMLEADPATGRFLTATSIGNLVRLCRPAVILDEGHKATSDLARRTIDGFNPSVVVELSATPAAGTNILSRVTGNELLEEEMIKLPLNIATSDQKSWRDVLTQARDRRAALAEKSMECAATAGKLQFYLECSECRFQIPPSIQIRSTRPLVHRDGAGVARSLFDYVEDDSINTFERAVALCLDRHSNVLWWYRNLVGPQNFAIQGYRRHRIHPDFVVQGSENDQPVPRVMVIESKGEHLEGNPDTLYKRSIADVFNSIGRRVTWQKLGEDFHDHVFRFQVLDEAQDFGRNWEDELQDVVRGLVAG
jgi:hypothetical protein